MLSLEEIKEKTIWVAKMTYGHRFTGTFKEIEKYSKDEECKDFDIVNSKGQPKELQEFYKDYEYATYRLGRHDLYLLDDFYNEWSKNPNQFKPTMRPVIDTLNNVIASSEYKNVKNWRIQNYDFNGVGNHYKDNYEKALKDMECDFDVVSIVVEDDTIIITIQSTNDDLVNELSHLSNEYAIRNSRF